MFAYTCVHGHRPPDANCVAENVYSVWIWGVWTEAALANIQKCLEFQLFMLALDMWMSRIKDLFKQITS